MSFADNKALVESPWLAEHLADPDLRILDCTWHHVSTNLDGRTQYRGRHLPGAVHFDIDHVCDRRAPCRTCAERQRFCQESRVARDRQRRSCRRL